MKKCSDDRLKGSMGFACLCPDFVRLSLLAVLASLLRASCFTVFLVMTLNFVLKHVGIVNLSLSISTIVFVTLTFKR